MKLPSIICLLASLIPLQGFAQSAKPSSEKSELVLSIPGEELVPAALGVRNDGRGLSWNVEKNGNIGRVGNAMVNSGLQLVINQESFETYQPRMTRDGKEFVIHGRPFKKLTGLQVARRVRFIEETGALRYIELFFNGSPAPLDLSVSLTTSFSGNYRSAITNRANLDPILLGEGEQGVLVTPGISQSNRGFLFTLCGVDSVDKPTISSQNRYGLKFQYQLQLAPGETKAIAHTVSQVVVPDGLGKKVLADLFAPYQLDVDTQIPAVFTETVVNRSPKTNFDRRLIDSKSSFESLGVIQGDSDTLAAGDNTRLYGDADIGRFTIRTDFGKATLSGENIVAVSGRNSGLRERIRVFMKDGQILSGQIPDGEFKFSTKSGDNRTISFEKLDRLVLAKTETKESLNNEEAMILTWSGDRLRLSSENNLVFFGVTPWGEITFTLADLVDLVPASDKAPGYEVRLTDGTKCRIFLTSRDLILNSEELGALTLQGNQVKGVVPNQPQFISTNLTQILLTGNQRIAGEMVDEKLSINRGSESLSIATKDIRRVSQVKNEHSDPINPKFLVELWDGSNIGGIIHSGTLAMKIREEQWQLPLANVIQIENPGPMLDPDKRVAVAKLIKELGSDEWATRETATTELSKLGKVTISMLNRELNQNSDPEIRRRIERILSSYKETF